MDPTLTPNKRATILARVREGGKPEKIKPPAPLQILQRKEVAVRLGRSLSFVDKLAKTGKLRRQIVPGRKYAIGFLASDVDALFPKAA